MPIAFFFVGFVFDAVMIGRIDDWLNLVQQAVYLVLSIALVSVEVVEEARQVPPPAWLRKVWQYREALLHFLLGGLLNAYTIFYFKSASALSSFFFIFGLIALLIVNEFYRFEKSRIRVHLAFVSLCSISYFVSLMPIALGFIGDAPFLLAVTLSAALFVALHLMFRRKLALEGALVRSQVALPAAVIHAVFVVLYYLHAIPPVPLSVKYMGIYHDVKKTPGEYELVTTRPRWRFWEHGDQTFLAKPGDVIHCYAQIFSPARFKDQLQVRWLYHGGRGGWQTSDAIPLPIVGGREEGYRGVTKKANYKPGEWRVQIETMDGREIGRIGFTVIPVP